MQRYLDLQNRNMHEIEKDAWNAIFLLFLEQTTTMQPLSRQSLFSICAKGNLSCIDFGKSSEKETERAPWACRTNFAWALSATIEACQSVKLNCSMWGALAASFCWYIYIFFFIYSFSFPIQLLHFRQQVRSTRYKMSRWNHEHCTSVGKRSRNEL